MSKAYEFLKECGAFFVLSINGDYPAGRPFGAVMECIYRCGYGVKRSYQRSHYENDIGI